MAIDNYRAINLDAVKEIENSLFAFYLTGSCFFLGAGNDIDFFVQIPKNPETEKDLKSFLLRIGFKPEHHSNYTDNNCIAVWRKPACSFYKQIDIQFVLDATLKEIAQNAMKAENIFNPTTEDWNNAFRYIKYGIEWMRTRLTNS